MRVTDVKRGSLGQAIRRRREELGLNREHVAAKADVSMSTVVRVENGGDALYTSLTAIAAALETTISELLSGAAA